ncbi:Fic family protein [Sulfobacillus acidophilus]|uniref:Fic family protein n=1 Tax=Sulfobacillus acidophilus TaxID=53633 RepID=A0ABS3AVS4_9FIRM|nr:Fic family protein [Sulfobacillus acidophilus]
MKNYPPFSVTPLILTFCQQISRELGYFAGANMAQAPIKLRRANKIKTIQSSLAIEGNTLSIEQITAILAGKRVLGPKKDIVEVNNALLVYEDLAKYNPSLAKDLLRAHKVLMKNLNAEAGKYREKGVGVFDGTKVAHMAPPAKRLPYLMTELFNFLKSSSGVSWLIKACVFHYELEFIHPFEDGNGRMGRLWQQLLLMKEDAVFEYVSVESIIKSNQKKYYKVLGQCDKAGTSTLFIEFMLGQILSSLKTYSKITKPQKINAAFRLKNAKKKIIGKWFSRKEYMQANIDMSSATASRDLLNGAKKGLLIKKGDKNQLKYKFGA